MVLHRPSEPARLIGSWAAEALETLNIADNSQGKRIKLGGFFRVHSRAVATLECTSPLVGPNLPHLPRIDEQHRDERQNKDVPREERCEEEATQDCNV